MTTKPNRYFWIILLVFLTACGKQAAALPADTAVPVVVSPSPLPTFTLIPVTITPSPLPTQPIVPMITPDPIQIEQWKEYENALASTLFPVSFIPGEFLCEWEVLGNTNQEIYVWVVCMSIFSPGSDGFPYKAMMPAVIQLKANGAVQNVKIPGGGADYAPDVQRMFPPDAQERIFGDLIHYQELIDHLNWRREHPEEPPIIVLSATPTP